MAVTVIEEDGTVIADANSYWDIASADTFLQNHEYTEFPSASPDKQSLSITEGARFVDHWLKDLVTGTRVDDDQTLLFPLSGQRRRNKKLILNDEIPVELQNASAIMANHHRRLKAEGESLYDDDPANTIEEVEFPDGARHEYKTGSSVGYPKLYADAWSYLENLIQPGRRNRRA